ncbi:serine hydrolase [Labilithrix luteola]|nr:serine hydrolase domain-containing protein [Labilithrix luteola]
MNRARLGLWRPLWSPCWGPLALLLAGCAGQAALPPSTPEPRPEAAAPREAPFEQVHEPTTYTLPGGSSFAAPRDYWVRSSAFAELEDPGHRLRVTLIEVEAGSAKAALEQGWARLGRHAPARIGNEDVDRDAAGWDEIEHRFYRTPPSEERVTMASARRKGTHALVAIVEASNEAALARQDEISSIVASLRIPGFEAEDVHDRKPVWDGDRARALAEFVESTRGSLGVPGASIAVIRDGAIVFEKGFGRRAIAAREVITAETKFRLGTMSESLAAKILARVTTAAAGLPGSTQMLATLPALDLSALGSIVDPTPTLRAEAPHLTLDFSGPMTASIAATMLPGVATTATAFGPLVASGGTGTALGGYAPTMSLSQLTMPPAPTSSSTISPARIASSMTSPTVIASVSAAAKTTGVAQALSLAGSPGMESEIISELSKKAKRALGGTMDTSAHELARFALVELAYGRRLTAATPLATELRFEPRRPHVSLGSKSRYGVRLAVGDTSGVRTVSHAGGSLGALVRVVVVPDEKLGLVMMTNANTEEAAALTDATFQRFVELTFGTKELATSLVTKALEGKHRLVSPTIGNVPSDLAQRLVGTWESPDLGTLVISADKKRRGVLVADAGEWVSPLGYLQEDGVSFVVPLAPETGHERLRVQGDKLLITTGDETFSLEKARRKP